MDNKRQMMVGGLVLLIVAIFFVAMNIMGIHVTLDEHQMAVQAPLFGEAVAYSEIEQVELQSDLNYGSRSWGSDFIGVKTGTFSNSQFNSYQCAVVSSQKEAIVIRKTDGQYLVFNVKNTEELHQIANELKQEAGNSVQQ